MILSEKIFKSLQSFFPSGASLHEPSLGEKERVYISECLDSTLVSSVGPFVDRFERELERVTGATRAVAVCNGTSALHAALHLVGVSPGDEVLIPALTFVATANAVLYCQASPHFVDVENEFLGVDPKKLRDYLQRIAVKKSFGWINSLTGRPLKALVVMHAFGMPAQIEELQDVAKEFSLNLIEDAAESLGSYYKNRHTGTFGAVGVLSFNGNKIVTSGGGGAILTNNSELGNRAKHITTTAKVPHAWAFNHDEMGFNYRMPNLNAALALAQLEQLPAFLKQKRKLAQFYQIFFSDFRELSVAHEDKQRQSNYWLNTICFTEEFQGERDELLKLTNQSKILTRPVWTLMHKLSYLSQYPRMDLTVSEGLEQRLLCLPSSAFLGTQEKFQ